MDTDEIKNSKPQLPRNNLIGRIVNYVMEDLSKDLHPQIVSHHFEISVVTLRLLFKKKYDCTFRQFVEKKRMDRAGELLVRKSRSVKEVMHLTGYHNRSTFIRIFKKHFDCLPSDLK